MRQPPRIVSIGLVGRPNGAKDEFLLAATAQNLRKLACPSSDDLRQIAGFQKGGPGSSAVEIMRHGVDAASDDWRLFVV